MDLVLAALSALVVLRLCGVDRRWPWRIADLSPATGRRPSSRPRSRWRRRGRRPARERRAFDRAVEQDLPLAADLLRLAVSAGHSLHTAVAAVGETGAGSAGTTGAGPVRAALGDCARAFDRGARLTDELEDLPHRLGPALGPLSAALVVALHSGSPVGPALQRLADAERRRRRRLVEARVRRLPVLLLAPLVGLVLPAFVLLTVVPVGLTTARAASGLVPP